MEKLRLLRKERGLTNQQMADFLGVSKGSYNYYELGKTEPNIQILKKLADFFCVTVDYLIGATPKDFNGETLSEEEKDLIKFYRGIGDVERRGVLRMVQSFYQQAQEDKTRKSI